MKIKPISRWPRCRLEDRKTELPSASGVYAVLDRKRVMYIGRSGDLRRRWSSGHHRYGQADKLKAPMLAWTLLSKSEINKVETALIREYRPAWNGTKVEETSSWLTDWKSGWRLRVAMMVLAAIAGAAIGLVSLRVAPSAITPPTTEQPP